MKIHINGERILETTDQGLVEAVVDYLIGNEMEPYRISNDQKAIIVKDCKVFFRDRNDPEDDGYVDDEANITGAWVIRQLTQ